MIKIVDLDRICDASLNADCIITSKLDGYTAEMNRFGEALSYPGGYCVSIKMVKPGSPSKCLRCWHRPEINNIDILENMSIIAEYLISRQEYIGSYFTDFEVIPEALKVDGEVIPGIVMDWIEGETLKDYVVNRNHTSNDLMKIAAEFKSMCSIIRQQNMSHGDLSSSNIIIRPGTHNLLLIDYDSLYFQEMGQKNEFIVGAPDYQHRGRAAHRKQELYCDNFSQHIIYTALLIFASKPDLRPSDMIGQRNQYLYFRREDIASAVAFKSSEVYKTAKTIRNEEIKEELEIILDAIAGTYEAVPALSSSYYEPAQPIDKYFQALFCTNCGHSFSQKESEFRYCPICGYKRHIYKEL